MGVIEVTTAGRNAVLVRPSAPVALATLLATATSTTELPAAAMDVPVETSCRKTVEALMAVLKATSQVVPKPVGHRPPFGWCGPVPRKVIAGPPDAGLPTVPARAFQALIVTARLTRLLPNEVTRQKEGTKVTTSSSATADEVATKVVPVLATPDVPVSPVLADVVQPA